MICAIDPDGRAPLSSGRNGDSGGPLMAGTYDALRVLGVVSYGGGGCGKDHLPSVFAEVQRYRSFILSPHPVLAPQTSGEATVTRSAAGSPAPLRRSRARPGCLPLAALRRGPFNLIGRGRGHTRRKADRGTVITCMARPPTRVATRLRSPSRCGSRAEAAIGRTKGRRTRPLRGSGRAGRSGSWRRVR